MGFLPRGRHRELVPKASAVVANSHDEDEMCNCSKTLLHPGDVVELRARDVDRIFDLKKGQDKMRVHWLRGQLIVFDLEKAGHRHDQLFTSYCASWKSIAMS